MKKLLAAVVLLAAAACFVALPALCDMWDDPTDPEATGGLTGKLNGGNLQKMLAVEQVAFKFYNGWVNGDTYSVTGLPPGKYDVFLKTEEDVIEGLRLDVFGETEKLSKEDDEAIWKLVKVSDDFFHEKRIARKGGTGKLQKLVVEQIRTDTIFNPDGSIAVGKMIRRIDYTILRKTREVWQIDPKCPRFLFREECDKTGKGSKINFHFDEKLGSIRVADTMVTAPEVTLAKKEEKKK